MDKLTTDDTSWGKVADWYSNAVLDKDSYQQQVVLPHLLRLLKLRPKDRILDLACGSGFFSHEFAKAGVEVLGVDIAQELIALAVRHASPHEKFLVAPADKIPVTDQSFTHVTIVLALQNIQNLEATFFECQRVLQSQGSLYIVLNHPTFRVPRASSWGFDEKADVNYRRVDRYMSESRIEIDMHPGKQFTETTISFHRPLQVYMKALRKCGFAVTALEEWISHKKSERGPRAKAEDIARKEIPLFLYLEARKLA